MGAAAFEKRIPETLPDMDRKWRSALSHDETSIIEDAVGDLLKTLGYLR